VKDRGKRLVNILDAYVLGAVPPYNMLLGGKLVASLVRTRDIYDDFLKIYGKSTGIISRKKKSARLLVVTTSSSLGRSSVYGPLACAFRIGTARGMAIGCQRKRRVSAYRMTIPSRNTS
jgi:hypothetical protein